MRLAFIGFGEAGQAFARSLRAAGAGSLAAHDVLQGTPRGQVLEAAAVTLGVRLAGSHAAAVRGADVIVSAVTAGRCLDAVGALAPALAPGQIVLDINSVSPGCKAEAAARVRATGAAYVDMAVMAPVHPRLHRTPVFVAGDLAGPAEAALRSLGFDFRIAGPEPGQAAAIKMIRSLFVKGVEALTVQTLTAAARAGCLDTITASLADTYDGLSWQSFAPYQFERVARHGPRRAEEMRECARSLAEAGFAEGAALAEAVAALHQAAGGNGADPAGCDTLQGATTEMLKALGHDDRAPRPTQDEKARL